jgi:hypothetical protein
MRIRARSAGCTLFTALAATALGCAGTGTTAEVPDEFAWEETAAEETSPLSGENLAQARVEMQRAQRDLRHYFQTLRDLRDRSDPGSYNLFSSYLAAYLGLQLDPLLAGDWQSRHPELMTLDANLRLAKAQILGEMRDTGRVQEIIDDLEARYAGRENLLVEFPIGNQRMLGKALKALRDGKWNG